VLAFEGPSPRAAFDSWLCGHGYRCISDKGVVVALNVFSAPEIAYATETAKVKASSPAAKNLLSSPSAERRWRGTTYSRGPKAKAKNTAALMKLTAMIRRAIIVKSGRVAKGSRRAFNGPIQSRP
jgi:hypothetical protein